MDIGDQIQSIEGFNSRKKHAVLTEQIIDNISDDELEQAVLDCLDFKIKDNYEQAYETISKISSGFRMVYSTWWLEAEIHNGGFNQFFWNRGEFAEEALEGLRLLDATEHIRLMEKAIEMFVEEEPQQREYYLQNTVEAFRESYQHTKLHLLDEGFYDLPQLSPMRLRYIRRHKEQFVENTSILRRTT